MSKWQRVKLTDICKLNMGQSPESSSYNQEGIGIPFYQGNADFGELHPTARYYCDKPTKIASKEDILLSVRAPIGALNIAQETCCIGRGLSAITPIKERTITKFIYYVLKQKTAELQAKGTGSTFKAISKQNVSEIEIPLPPLETQKQIAKTLDTAAELLAMRKQQLAELDDQIKSTFYDMFGDPVANEKGWDVVNVGDVTDCIVPGRDKPKSFTGEIPWITTGDLITGGFTYTSSTKIGLTEEEISKVNARIIPKNSVIMSCVGDIGITSIAGKDLVMNQQLHSFQCGERVNNIFLCTVLPFYKSQMKKRATSTTVLYMNKTACNSIKIILPPLSLQSKFASIVIKINEQKALVQKAIKESQLLLDSLMSEYFE